MELKSEIFDTGGNIPSKYTCDGENINPPLLIDEVPENTQSFVLIMDDPDATGGGTFDHWVLWNIEPETRRIKEGDTFATASHGTNSFGKTGYGGPCPPKGNPSHRYMFKLYALGSMLDLAPGSKKQEVEKAMNGRILEQTILMGRYGRQ